MRNTEMGIVAPRNYVGYVVALLLWTTTPLAAEANTFETSPSPIRHLEKSECASCHLGGAAVTPENARLLVGNEKRLCQTCHENSVRLSHRSGFITRAKLPAEFALNWKSELVCSTCHLIHAPKGKMLKTGRRGKEFCFSCHDQKFFSELAAGGVRIALSGHETISLEFLVHDLDPGSIVCLRCHIAFKGRREAWVDPSLIARHSVDVPYDHPIGKVYRNDAGTSLRPLDRVSTRIQLPQGKVSCLSCHKKEGSQHGQLLLPMKKERLCRECHELGN